MRKTTWRKLFRRVFAITGDTFENTIITLSNEELDIEFDYGHKNKPQGKPFTAWSDDYVYFPCEYCGSEWIDYVARNPNDKPTKHIGGG